MYRQKAFALLTAVVIVAFLAAAGLTVYYYKDTVSNKISELRQNNSNEVPLTVTPLPSDTPSPTATPTSTPRVTSTPVVRTNPNTIAEITPSTDPVSTTNSLPRSGPEDIPLILGGIGSLTSLGIYRYSLKRKFKKALHNITIS